MKSLILLPAAVLLASAGSSYFVHKTHTPGRAVQEVRTAPTSALLTGTAAMGDWRTDAPGVRRHITVEDLPPPHDPTGDLDEV